MGESDGGEERRGGGAVGGGGFLLCGCVVIISIYIFIFWCNRVDSYLVVGVRYR